MQSYNNYSINNYFISSGQEAVELIPVEICQKICIVCIMPAEIFIDGQRKDVHVLIIKYSTETQLGFCNSE